MSFLRVLLLIGLALLPFIPVGVEFLRFIFDKKKGISYKRFRILVLAVVYYIVVLILLITLQKFVRMVEAWSVVQWLADKISIASRISYSVTIIASIVINTAIGIGFIILQSVVRIGLKNRDFVKPKLKNGEYSLFQKIGRSVIRFFHKESWFFVGSIAKYLSIVMTAIFFLLFILYLLPVLFGAGWIPYKFLRTLVKSSYLYPCLGLLLVWQVYFFLAGIEQTEEECPEVLKDEGIVGETEKADLDEINKACRENFGAYYKSSVKEDDK